MPKAAAWYVTVPCSSSSSSSPAMHSTMELHLLPYLLLGAPAVALRWRDGVGCGDVLAGGVGGFEDIMAAPGITAAPVGAVTTLHAALVEGVLGCCSVASGPALVLIMVVVLRAGTRHLLHPVAIAGGASMGGGRVLGACTISIEQAAADPEHRMYQQST